MDHAELARLVEMVTAEKTAAQHHLSALQDRVTALTKTAEGLQALLDLTPESAELVFKGDADTAQAVEAARVVAETEPVTRAVEAPSRPMVKPNGVQAAKLILESDQSRFWSVRDVWDEEIRRGWAEPERVKGRNPPARIALVRLKQRYPENVEVVNAPVLAYRWRPETSPSQNGSGSLHTEVAA